MNAIQIGAFKDCSSLCEITIPNGIKNIEAYTFSGCTSLENFVIPNTVTTIGDNAFTYCPLAEVIIPNAVTEIGDSAFSANDRVTSVVIPDSVTSLGANLFSSCGSLTEVVLGSGCNILPQNAFSFCPALKEITIPANFMGDSGALVHCDSLERIILPSSYIMSSISTGMSGNKALKSYSVYPCGAVNNISAVDGVLFANDGALCRTLLRYPSGKTDTLYVVPDFVETVANEAFTYCENLTSIVFSEGVTSLGSSAISGHPVIRECRNLESLVIPSTVTFIGSISGCPSLTTIYGSAGSYAETWAAENGYTFVAQ